MTGKKPDKKRWVRDVKTVSTFPPEKLFTQDAETIAKSLASKKVSCPETLNAVHISSPRLPAIEDRYR